MMTMLMFMTSIYWGQLGDCEKPPHRIRQYTCDQPSAYRAVCAFAVLLFISQIAFTAVMVMWRSEFIDDVGLYDEISGNPNAPHGAMLGAAPYEPSKSSFSQPAASTDL